MPLKASCRCRVEMSTSGGSSRGLKDGAAEAGSVARAVVMSPAPEAVREAVGRGEAAGRAVVAYREHGVRVRKREGELVVQDHAE